MAATYSHHSLRLLITAIVVVGTFAVSGCTTTPRQFMDSLKGNGFPGWSESMAGSVRGGKDTKSSGFFTDRRSEQIEKDLGGF
jgi:hypothetical protein